MQNIEEISGLSITGCRWRAANVNEVKARELSNKLHIHPIVGRALVWRGLTEVSQAQQFISTSLSKIPDPTTMLNMDRAEVTILKALQEGTPIRIVGDYDCDGTTGLITLLQAFRLINPATAKNISYHVPDREKDGYGLNPGIIEKAAAEGVKILISVDIGITAHSEWAMAKEKGITGICIDHHTILGSRAPEDAIVLCPKQAGCTYPEKDLAACGISLQLTKVLLNGHSKQDAILQSLCKLVAIGTISDMVPLNSYSNRAIVQAGLRGLSSGSTNKGLEALLTISGLQNHKISSYDLGFKLGPRINAAGRMDGSTLQVVSLLDAASKEDAWVMASQIDELNRQRQAVQQWLVEQILKKIEIEDSQDLVYVFGGEHEDGWHQGVVGIAASKIVERYGRPALICSIRDGIAHGSARSIKALNIVQALEAVSDGILLKYGGHTAAAGFSLKVENLNLLRKRINAYAQTILTKEDLIHTRIYEGELNPTDINLDLIRTLALLEPHGIENPRPSFVIKGRLIEIKIIANKHLRMRIAGKGPSLEAIWWHHSDLYDQLRVGTNLMILGKLEINDWNGSQKPQLNIDDLHRLN
ncbi:MAG: single-stranded-DNA-specific exonuclease RecJ [Acidobacteria bacterium]|nr:single-stranded-DNA-specific exonuclease RecJ [Acidobacteriota bacterium]